MISSVGSFIAHPEKSKDMPGETFAERILRREAACF